MREKEEGKVSSPRRNLEDEFQDIGEELSPMETQSIDTLRAGYSWIHALEARYPGWHLQAVEGFPFTLPRKKLSESRTCLVSFAGIYRKGQKPFNTSPGIIPASLRAMKFKDRGDWSFREISLDAESTDLSIAHAHFDHSEAEEDINCVFPMIRLVELEVEGFVGECAETHYTFMGYVPEAPLIVETAKAEILPRLKKRGVDVAIISGGCELSHQSAALIQREIEAAGIATVGISVCPDITERLQVPRAVALRFPMGSPFGPSMDPSMHLRVLRDALSLIDTAKIPGEIVALPYDWIKT
jgi:D-proline reductase (dithiol) PrdB